MYLSSKFFPNNCQPKVVSEDVTEDEIPEDESSSEESAKVSSPEEDFLSNHAVCMCDDDNDLEMALACQHAYLPDVSSESMSATITKFPDHFTTTFSESDDESMTIKETDASDLALSMIWTRTKTEPNVAPENRYRLTKRKISLALCFAAIFAWHC